MNSLDVPIPNDEEKSPVLGTQPQVEESCRRSAVAVAVVVAAGHRSDRRSHEPGHSTSPWGFVAEDRVLTFLTHLRFT